jgi:hypothetical protein
MDIAPALLLSTLVWKAIDFLRQLSGRQWSGVVTQLCVWVGGVVVLWVAAASELFETFAVNGVALTDLDSASVIFLGLCIGSLGSAIVDVKQAIDGKDDASKPPLIGP